MWKTLMLEISAKKLFCYVNSGILGSEGKHFGFGPHFPRSSGAVNMVLYTIETFNEHSRIAKLSQPYLREHMRWNVTRLYFPC